MNGFTEKETDMRSQSKLLVLMSLVVLISSLCYGATVTGTVKTPDGAPFEGAIAQAQNTKTRIATIVLSDSQGHYRIEKLPAGEYRVEIRAVGYRSDSHTGVNLTAEQSTSVDTALQKGQVHWNELSIYQAGKLWPASKAKDKIFSTCFTCHGFQTRMASVTRDQDGWHDRVQFMLEAMRFGLADRINDQEGAEVADYLTSLYGPDSVLPKSPADLPEYKGTLRSLSGGSPSNIVFVEYEMPGPSRMPFDANPAKDGSVWIPDFGVANKITKLDPETGEMQDFPVPNVGTAAVHSAVAAPDGSVWLTEQASDKLGRWDPVTQKITEYQDAYAAGLEGREDGGSRHPVRIDSKGRVWWRGS